MTRSRLIAVLLALVLVVAGCSDDDDTATPPAQTPPAQSNSASSAAAADDLDILVSNDDGVAGAGMDALVQALVKRPGVKVTVVAPAENQSGSGGKTSADPTGAPAKTVSGYDAIAVNGFPADAVNYALTNVFTADNPPDLVMTGSNAGQNLGPFTDTSGTIGAARAGAQRGIVAVAVSSGFPEPFDFAPAVTAAMTWLDEHEAGLRAGTPPPISVVVINSPTCTSGTVRGTVEVAPDPAAPPADALAPANCASTAGPAATDVPAFLAGFTTISEVPIQPVPR